MSTLHSEKMTYEVNWEVRKYKGDLCGEECELLIPDDVLKRKGNLVVVGGASALWERFIGTSISAFSNANAKLGVGNSTTAEADGQTDLQGASKVRVAMDSTYPQHSDSTSTTSAKSIVFRSTMGSAVGNFAWEEWALFNASTSGRMFNRKVESMGTKTSAATWQLLITFTFS